MNISKGFWMVVCWSLLAVAPVLADEAGEMRLWTSRNGATLEATLVSEQWDQVILEQADGTRIRIALNQLIPEDQVFIRSQTAPQRGSRSAPASVSTRTVTDLPTFASGRRQGAHVYYEAPKFDAVMDDKAYLRVYPKSKGQRVGGFITFRLVTSYHDQGMRGRPIRSWEAPARPQEQPSSLVLRGRTDTDSFVTYSIDFSREDLQFRFQVEDPGGISHPTDVRVYVYIQRPAGVTKDMKFNEVTSKVAEHRLVMFPDRRNRMEVPFHEDVTARITRNLERVEIISPDWDGLKPVFTVGDARRTRLRPGFDYGAVALWEGFHLMFSRERQDTDNPREFLKITLE